MIALRQIFAILHKDLLLEVRDKQVMTAMLVFALVVVVVFHFFFESGAEQHALIIPGMLWVVIIFSGNLCFNRSFGREQENGRTQGLIVCPVDKSTIYVAKLIVNLCFMLMMECLLLPLMVLLFDLRLGPFLYPLLLVIFLGTLGFTAVGTLFSAISANTKSSEVMLPILLFPVSVPVMLAATKSTAALFQGRDWDGILAWLKLLSGFDLLFLVVCFLLYDYVLED